MKLLEHAPRFSNDEAVRLAREIYGVSATASPLPSERDQNFLLRTSSGERFVLKIANATDDRAMLDAQDRAMMHVAERTSLAPRVIPPGSGDAVATATSASGVEHQVRLVTYLPGVPLGSVRRHSPELLQDLGRALGRIDSALADFDHPAAHREFHWDMAKGPLAIDEFGDLIADAEMRELVVGLGRDFEGRVLPRLSSLRRSVVHHDANDYNVIVGGGDDLQTRNQSVVGLIDFGDMLHSYTVANLAVAVAYAVLDKPDPLDTAARIAAGYHSEHPLDEQEIAVLFDLVRMRLCMSVAIGADQQRQRPGDDYLAISQQPIRNTLPRLASIHPRLAEAVLRHACGLPPVPSSPAVCDWLRANAHTFAPLLEVDLRTEPCITFNLGVDSPLLAGNETDNPEPHLTPRLFGAMAEAGVKVGIGRYDEPRWLYTSPLFAESDDPAEERRTIHLGIDLFAEAGSPVFAPLAGEVHTVANNTAPQDYGPLIVLTHRTDDGHTFHTLYGHLGLDSIEGLREGQPVAGGERLATIGTADVNGGWMPHLHFQLITDLLDRGSDFPGVALAGQREVWRALSPDPNLILGIPAERLLPGEPTHGQTLAARRRVTGSNLSLSYREPVKVVRGWMQYLYDEEGRRYLDAYNNVPHVGHCHPRVVRAGRDQMGVVNTNTRYLSDLFNRYADRLCSLLPDPLGVCFLVNSGSEANELALRLARAHTGNSDVIVLEAAYHGHTGTLIDLSPYKHAGPGGRGAPPWVHVAPLPDTYRGSYKRDDPRAGEKYAGHVGGIVDRLRQRGPGPAAFLAESLPSVGGQIVLPPGYLAAAYAAVRDAGGLCIADEIQTGYGRIGTHFWGFESQDVVPDIVALGKPIGNGHPIGAVITTPEIAASFDTGMEFFSTFGGNSVSCAIGRAVLDVVVEEDLQSHALRVGERILQGLRSLMARYPIIGDVRGSGLFLGVELVRDRETLEPATEEAAFVVNRLREQRILIGTDGPHDNVLKIRPPMPFNEADADHLLSRLDGILADDFID